MVGRTVNGTYRDASEHRKSVTAEMVARVNLATERSAQQHEQRKLKKAGLEVFKCAQEALGPQKVSAHSPS